MTVCLKRRYRDRIEALLAMTRTGRNPNRPKYEKRAYPCRDCKGWHLTSRK